MTTKKKPIHTRICSRLLRMTAPLWPDRQFLQAKFYLQLGYKLDLEDPRTFNEKLQWLKLYDRRPEYTQMVDKIEAKKYAASIIGDEHIIPTIAIYDSVEEIDFDALPNQFVLKCTHDSGGIVICSDKSKLDRNAAIRKLRKGLKRNYFWQTREYPYRGVKPRIIAEQYMSDDTGDLNDYKVHNFNGVPEVILVCRDRFKDGGLKEDFYSIEWKHLDCQRPGQEQSATETPKPNQLEEMIKLSKLLSEEIPFVRTDFYAIGDKLFFGELTFYPASGLKPFTPQEWDKKLGDWLVLPVMGGVNWLLVKEDAYVLIRQEYISAKGNELSDYKWFCFNGEPKYLFVATDRFNRAVETKFDFYDNAFQHLPFTNGHPNANRTIKKPTSFEQMKLLAAKLSKGIPQVRVDFYDVNGQVYFGEMTFFHWGGFVPFEPREWDEIFGSAINLPTT